MASDKLNKQTMWLITVISKRNLLYKDRDFIAELVSEEARKTREPYSFILHDIVESKKYSEMLIEGREISLTNLLSVLKNNLPSGVSYKDTINWKQMEWEVLRQD